MPHRTMNHMNQTQTTQQSRLKVFGDRSGFRSHASRSHRTSSGWFLPLLLVSSCSLLAGLLLSSSGLYEWFRDLDIQTQFRAVAVFSGASLLYAAAVREFCRDSISQWSGRVAGFAGVVLLMVFAWRSAMMCASTTVEDHVERHFAEQQIVTTERGR